jgi:hypothetical protein
MAAFRISKQDDASYNRLSGNNSDHARTHDDVSPSTHILYRTTYCSPWESDSLYSILSGSQPDYLVISSVADSMAGDTLKVEPTSVYGGDGIFV